MTSFYWSWSYKNTTLIVEDQVLLGQTGLGLIYVD